MKTFLEFIAEAEGDADITKIRAKIRDLTRRGRPGDQQEIARLSAQVSELMQQQKVGDAVRSVQNSDRPQQRTISSRNTLSGGGVPQKPRDPISSVGTTAHHDRKIVNMSTGEVISPTSVPSDTAVSGSQSDTRGRSQGGGTTPLRNRNVNRSGGRERAGG
jgi:hypothetical protein